MTTLKAIIGANYGDEGKGRMTDYFASQSLKQTLVVTVITVVVAVISAAIDLGVQYGINFLTGL